eukprot:CAMPEP_0170186286 /NCGR_PEP_ID=MMETSP0040_2-20121228/38697_1 /TAXON_ID=641309 /ORGANISM="Lotharella oceanica, Strain CCMP622" /LENGTH=77 /DNA_ID=CAMNT_0010432969 /DNA_START=265 /DNA_END=495 /DNA_ORIENTATION=+
MSVPSSAAYAEKIMQSFLKGHKAAESAKKWRDEGREGDDGGKAGVAEAKGNDGLGEDGKGESGEGNGSSETKSTVRL